MIPGKTGINKPTAFSWSSRATERNAAGLPYTIARTVAGLTQAQAAEICGIDRTWYSKCESQRKRYHIRELAVLRKMSGLSWDEFGAILDEAAKPL